MKFLEKKSDSIILLIGCWIIAFGLINLFEVQRFGLSILISYGYIEVTDIFIFLMLIIFGYKFIVKKSTVSWSVVNVLIILLILEDIFMVSFCYEKIIGEKRGNLLDLINAYSPAFYPRLEMKNALIRIILFLPILIVLWHRIFLKKFQVNRKTIYLTIILAVFCFFCKKQTWLLNIG